MKNLYVYSGECCLCPCGDFVGADDTVGRPIATGDIVLLYSGDYIGTDLETWIAHGLTVAVSDRFTSYTDGKLKLNENFTYYVMGIRSHGFSSPEWMFKIVKKHHDVVVGEHWPDFRFHYEHNSMADKLLDYVHDKAEQAEHDFDVNALKEAERED